MLILEVADDLNENMSTIFVVISLKDSQTKRLVVIKRKFHAFM
jgi:hypothetical protein